MLTIPEYFESNDVRKPPSAYVNDKLDQVLRHIFDVRREVEKTMTRRELVAYDKMLYSAMDKEAIVSRLKSEIQKDKALVIQLGQISELHSEGKDNEFKQAMKYVNKQ